jgi:hypothetical protein
MRLPRFLSIIILITGISITYVYQQTEIFRLAYAGQKQQTIFEDLLDKNSILRYNIEKSCSLVHLGSLTNLSDYQMPDRYQLVRLVPSRQELELKEASSSKETILSRLFGVKRQAEARTINP